MEKLLKELLFDDHEIEWLLIDLDSIGYSKVERIISILIKSGCSSDYIKEILFNHKRIFDLDLERINYTIEAILSNGDIIEETLLELV